MNAETLDALLKISLVIFMAGNLLDMGLRLKLGTALVGLRNMRFVSFNLLWCFFLGPPVAWRRPRSILDDGGVPPPVFDQKAAPRPMLRTGFTALPRFNASSARRMTSTSMPPCRSQEAPEMKGSGTLAISPTSR